MAEFYSRSACNFSEGCTYNEAKDYDEKPLLTIRFLFAYSFPAAIYLLEALCPSHNPCSPNSIRKWQTPEKFSNAFPMKSGVGNPTKSPERLAGLLGT